MYRELLGATAAQALDFLEGLGDRAVARPGPHAQLRARLGGALPAAGQDATEVIRALAAGVDEALVASAGPRYFGFVVGGTLPAALAADWLTSAWDQNTGLHVLSPAAGEIEAIVAGWVLDLLGLPASAGVGLVTGGQMANFTGLCAARGELLRRNGWEVDEVGLAGAPALRVLVGAEAHATIYTALRLLGLGRRQIEVVPVDGQGRMRADALATQLAAGTPGLTIICAQAGNVNTGAFDPMAELAAAAREHGAWLHVDGAFGLWAAADPGRRHLLEGHALCDSWATDAHKWLNVPYDCGLAIVRDPAAHRRAVGNTAAAYLTPAGSDRRDGQDWAPESSRRGRAFPLWAALRSLGRDGVAALVDRTCGLAARMATRVGQEPGVRVLNQVVLNQVLVGLDAPDPVAFTAAVLARVQREGTCWVGPTVWQGQPAIRISVSGWNTTEQDADRSAEAILACVRAERGG